MMVWVEIDNTLVRSDSQPSRGNVSVCSHTHTTSAEEYTREIGKGLKVDTEGAWPLFKAAEPQTRSVRCGHGCAASNVNGATPR